MDTSRQVAEALSEKGYTCIYDLGCNSPFLNYSGLFMAIRGPVGSIKFTPFAPEYTSGIGRWCHKGVLSAEIFLGRKIWTIANIHLNPGEEESDQEARQKQLWHYVLPILQGKKGPSLVVGDANLDMSVLHPNPLEGFTNALSGRVTCSDEGKHVMNGKPRENCKECEEKIDVALYDKEKTRVSNLDIKEDDSSDHYRISFTAFDITSGIASRKA